MIGSQIGRQTLSVTSTPVSLTLPAGKRPQYMRASVEIGAVRWECGPGIEPTGNDGQLAAVGSSIEFMEPGVPAANWIANFRVVALSGSATLQVQFFD